jgi:hypothetical protein
MRQMVKRYDRDTLLYKLKSMQLIDEAKLLVYLGNLHDITACKVRRTAVFDTLNLIVLNLEEMEQLKDQLQLERELMAQKGIVLDLDKVQLM